MFEGVKKENPRSLRQRGKHTGKTGSSVDINREMNLYTLVFKKGK